MVKKSGESTYHVYMVRCADGTFYTGIATDLKRRVAEHNEGEKGAKYTKARRPVTLVYSEAVTGRSAASKREYEIRHLKRAEKEKLVP